MKLEKLRAFLLEKGDSFLMFGNEYVVIEVTDQIYFISIGSLKYAYEKNILSFGLNSQQRIELIIKSNKHDNGKENTHAS